MAKNKPIRMSEDKKWNVESAANTLIEAEKIRQDKQLFSDAKKELKNRQKGIQKIIKRKK